MTTKRVSTLLFAPLLALPAVLHAAEPAAAGVSDCILIEMESP
jgi:hypothetical protein